MTSLVVRMNRAYVAKMTIYIYIQVAETATYASMVAKSLSRCENAGPKSGDLDEFCCIINPIQGSRDPLARSPRRVQTMSGLVQSQRVLVCWASNLSELF